MAPTLLLLQDGSGTGENAAGVTCVPVQPSDAVIGRRQKSVNWIAAEACAAQPPPPSSSPWDQSIPRPLLQPTARRDLLLSIQNEAQVRPVMQGVLPRLSGHLGRRLRPAVPTPCACSLSRAGQVGGSQGL